MKDIIEVLEQTLDARAQLIDESYGTRQAYKIGYLVGLLKSMVKNHPQLEGTVEGCIEGLIETMETVRTQKESQN